MKKIDQLDPVLQASRHGYKNYFLIEEFSAIVYYSEIKQDNQETAFMTKAYRGKRRETSFVRRFSSEKEMLDCISNWKNYLSLRDKNKKERRAERSNFKHDYSIGDILHTDDDWFYWNKQLKFYQVVGITDKSIRVCEIDIEPALNDLVKPVKNKFIGQNFIKRVYGSKYISLNGSLATKEIKPKKNKPVRKFPNALIADKNIARLI